MTQDEIIEMYMQVSKELCNDTEWCWAGVGKPLQMFAKLVAAKATAAEREVCAKVADEYATWGGSNFYFWFKALAKEIRARGEA